ncbi:MAG: transcription antitermination factor NusB [bacterium]|nr:transcription antitermination factor NusB [bacterium]
MKTAQDPRHQKRREIVKNLFAESFTKQAGFDNSTKQILSRLAVIDEKIKTAATAWPVDKLNKIDLAILRLAIYELDLSETPPKVVIDEAVELAKEFGGENSASFINGVLGNICKKEEKINEND